MEKCYLCENTEFNLRHKGVRDDPNINVLECRSCGLVTLDDFTQITDDFYEGSSMHQNVEVSIDDWLVETHHDDARRFNALKHKIIGKNVLDFGCGAGGFVKLCQNSATSVAGVELEIRVLDYWKQKLNITNSIPLHHKYDIITSFHVFEHLKDPLDHMQTLYDSLTDFGELIIEVPNADDALLNLYDCNEFKRFSYWGQHLFLYNANNLKQMAKHVGFENIFVKYIQRYPLANHLYWLAKRQPGGHEKWTFLNQDDLNSAYERQLAAIGQTDTLLLLAKK